ncbi:MAG: hypothetical protein UHD05_00515, partial [Ruminococcus sp.]|nr:hypothetical protein [Ruminococcus sp.]
MKYNKIKFGTILVLVYAMLLYAVMPVFANSTSINSEAVTEGHVVNDNDEVITQSTSDEAEKTDEDNLYYLDSVIVQLTNKASLELNDYTV